MPLWQAALPGPKADRLYDSQEEQEAVSGPIEKKNPAVFL